MRHIAIWTLAFGLMGCRMFPKTTDDEVVIPSNPFQRPSLDNPWVYSAIAWAETLILRRKGKRENLSEAYLSYRYFEEQLKAGVARLSQNGSFMKARGLIGQYGIMRDDDFLPGLSEADRAQRQLDAFSYLNDSLSSGPLQKGRSAGTVREELNKAFGVQFDPAKARILKSKDIKVGIRVTLARELEKAEELFSDKTAPKDLPAFSKVYSEVDRKLMKRVIRNLNANYPVILNWTVDFKALAPDGTFDLDLLKNGSGKQIWQSSIIEEYGAEGPDSKGNAFIVREGSRDQKLQKMAGTRGELTSLIVRNDWTGSERPEKDGTMTHNGYRASRLKANYLFGYFSEMKEEKKTGQAVRGSRSVIVSKSY